MLAPPTWLQPAVGPFEVVVMAASAGGLHAIHSILSALPADFPGAILIAHHRSRAPVWGYTRLLGSHCPLPVVEAREGAVPRAGTVYVAPAGRHMAVDHGGSFYTLDASGTGTVRPSADLLFNSVGAFYAKTAVAVVLSGYGRDGAEGVRSIRERGGFVIAQDRNGCEHFGMPNSAIETRRVDLVLPLRHIPSALVTLFATPAAV